MGLDPLSPIAPARVRVLLLPIGRIKRARFLSFAERLQPEHVVRLGDISPDGRPNRNMFSPLASPTGMIIYDLTTSLPPTSHLDLSPFETFREPFAVIALADGLELGHISYGKNGASVKRDSVTPQERDLRQLYQELEGVRDSFPKALVHELLLFDYIHKENYGPLHEGLVAVPPQDQCKTTTMKTIMCDISSLLLAEMTTLAKSVQAMTTVESPNASNHARQHSPWGNGHSDPIPRRNSHLSLSTRHRSNSPAIPDHRMSMPVIRSSSAASNDSQSSGRPTTPANRPASPAPTTFDDMTGVKSSPENTILTRANTGEMTRNGGQEKVSVQGFGSGSVSERARNKTKGRTGVIIGSLYLHAGRWTDALRELVEAATTAKANNDHLWHAKALENILVCMLVLGWAGLDFQIPQVCYTSTDKAPYHTPPAIVLEQRGSPVSRLSSLLNLCALLPELLDKIINLYNRAANFTGESLPQYPFSETVIRFSKLLAAVHLAGGMLDDNALALIVVGTPLPNPANTRPPRLNIHPTRSEIVTILFKAFPSSTLDESLTVIDRTIILSGIASVLGTLGYNRKKAMVMRELISVLIPGLVQARKLGAADMGVHPAAGLAALNAVNGQTNGAAALDLGEGDVESGIDGLLGLLGRIYGVVSFGPPSADPTNQDSIEHAPFDDSNEAIIARTLQNASIRNFGAQMLKINVLRACINVCEALPDFHGVLRFTTDLLRTAGSGIAPGPQTENALPTLSREEQVRLSTNISRTVGAANKLGLRNLEAEYWDEFLVRGVELESLPPARLPLPHKRTELEGGPGNPIAPDPLIYNPYLKKPDTPVAERLLVAGEQAVFKVTLQNPYEFELDIEYVAPEASGVELQSLTQATIVGAYRSQIVSVTAVPKSSGIMTITGCFVKVRGCRKRRFPIFTEPWEPQRELKVKAIGLAASMKSVERPVSTLSDPKKVAPIPTAPRISEVVMNVIGPQPVLIIKSSSPPQSAIMILEGERKKITVTLQNLSTTTPADLILFSFVDSTQQKTQAAMSNKDASRSDLYDLELLLSQKQALRWKKADDSVPFIAPGETATFEVELFGKPGLTTALIQVDYACLGVPPAELPEQFYTRQVSLPLTVTVNASAELVRLDVLPLAGNIANLLRGDPESKDATAVYDDRYCLLVMDFRNAWPSDLRVDLKLISGLSMNQVVLPGNSNRIVVPIPRIFIQNPHAPIPALEITKQRQFVVSMGKISPDTERTNREAFWYREEILKLISAHWSSTSSPSRSGEIELRGLHLSPRMIEALKVEDVGIEITVASSSSASEHKDSKPARKRFEVLIDEPFTLDITIHNRMTHPIYPLLRLQPSLRSQPHNLALDLSKKIVWNGTLQSSLPPLAAGESRTEKLTGTALCRGNFDICGSLEEVKVWDAPEGQSVMEENTTKGRKRADTESYLDELLGDRERRVWHTREACVVHVVDGEDW